MDRQEAVLRELNLYPLWKRRGEPASAEAQAQQSAEEPAVEAAVVPAVGEVAEPARAVAAEKGTGREQHIATLDWPELKTMVRDCTACKLRAGCTQTVFGVGDEQADWLFVGEGPGAEEDERGQPFVGKAGKLLDRMLAAGGLTDRVFITNTVFWRPPGNRTPTPQEQAVCLPFLERAFALIQPKAVLLLGAAAAKSVLQTDEGIMRMRGQWREWRLAEGGVSAPALPTLHPAFLLRQPQAKAQAWADILSLAARLDA